ncbi:hypothetical protein AB2B38_000890 [Balneola sp. MJW-20]|uniref:hypothetical protein n=1 Tax=Gracilimonas aurantiaca TaxID=3234185 RepID=UPI003465C3BE
MMKNISVLFMILYPIAVFGQAADGSHYTCWSSNITNSDDRIAFYADSRTDCSYGTVNLAYERFVRNIGDRPIYQNVHNIEVESDCPESCVYITQCLNEVDEYKPYMLRIDLSILKEEFFTDYKQAWTYDALGKKIISSSSFLVCRNNGYDE